nr:conserved hypothetical protein [Hymenolepis microstoma]
MGNDLIALSDLTARIIRYLRRGDPTVSIATVDEALDAFICEKRTTHRQELQTARAGRSIANLDTPSRALLLEHLIECVYDEIPSLTIRAEGNEDVLVLNAGQDALGSRYFYMDDLRLYRETPKSELTSTWSLAVGASANQWKSFIESIGSAPEEIELANFLKTEIFPVLENCFETVTKLTDDLNPSRLLDKELSELSKMRQLKGLPPLPPTTTSPSYTTCLPPTDNGVSVGSSNGGGSSAGSNSGNSTSTCPLTPPNGTPGVNQSSQPPPVQETSLKTSNTAPNTPSTLFWQPDGQSSSSTANNQQHTSLGQHPHSVGSISSVRSPPGTNNKLLQNSPLRRPSSGPMLEHELKQEGEAEGVKTHSAPSSVSEGVRKTSVHSQSLSNNSKLQSVPEGNSRDSKAISSSVANVQQQQHVSASSAGNRSAMPAAIPVSPATHMMVFTTEMANDAAVKNQRSRLRLTTYHSTHPTVQSYMLQHGMFHTTPAVAAAAAAIAVDGSSVTQEQLENRKNKMATLERIHFTLTKNKTSAAAQGVPPLQQQQHMYATGGQMGGSSASSCVATPIPPMQQHDHGHPPGDVQPMESRGMMMTNREMAWIQQQRRQQQQHQPLSTVHQSSPMSSGDPNGGMGHFPYSPIDSSMFGSPILVVPDNVYPSAPPQPPPNKFCVPAPPPYGNNNKRPYPSSDSLPSGLPDNQQSQFWGSQQQQVMMDQQQQVMMLQQQQQSQQSQNALPTSRATTGRGGSGVSKKRKTGTTAASRAAAARASGPQGPPSGFNPASQRMPPTQQPQIPSGMKPGGFGAVPIGPPRGNYQSAMMGGGDPLNGGPYANPSYRGGPMMGPGGMMDQPLYPSMAVGPGGQLPPSSIQQQQPLPMSGGYSHPPNDCMSPSSNSSTQHLTSASLASLARLSQLSGTEGPYCLQPPNSNPNVSTPAFSRMTSAPDMLGGGGFPGGGGPGMMSNPEGDPNSMYAMPGNPNTPGYQQQGVPMPQSNSQQPGFHPSSHQQTLGDAATVVSTRCITPSSAPPICAPPPTSTSPSTPTGGPAMNPLPSSQPPQSGTTSQQPQQQSSGPPQQQSGQFQQINYPHMNGNPQLHSGQYMQQQPSSRQFYGISNGSTCPPPPNQRLEPPRNLPQLPPPTNVQITPKTPHTIQYLPTTSTTTTAGLPGGNTTSISNAPSSGPYPPGPQKVRTSSGQKLQSPSHTQVAPNAAVQPTNGLNSLPPHPPSSANRRGPKMDQLPPAQQGSMVMSGSNPSDMIAGMPDGSEMYTTGPQPKYPSHQQQQRFPMTADATAQQSDNTNPFDFPQGATPYPNTTASQPRNLYRDPSIHFQQQPQPYPSSSTGPGYRPVETDSSQMVSAVPNTTVSAPSAATSGPQQSQQQMYMGGVDMNYPQSQPRWQQPQMMGGNGNDFYMQQQQGVVMMAPSQGGVNSQSQAAGFYMHSQPGGSGIPPNHLQQPPNPTPSHQQNQGHTSRPYPALL